MNIHFVLILSLGFGTMILLPFVIASMTLFMPCMPPILTSMIYLECKSWEDDGQAGILVRMGVSILTGYCRTTMTNATCLVVGVLLLYPVEVKLIILKVLKRFEDLY